MHVEEQQGTVLARLGSSFARGDAELVRNAVRTLAPGTKLVVDFTAVRDCHDAAFFSLCDALAAVRKVDLTLRGLTLHQSRLLKYLGLSPAGARGRR